MWQRQPKDRSDQDRRGEQPEDLPPAPPPGQGTKRPPPSAEDALRGVNLREWHRAVITDGRPTRQDGRCRDAFCGHRCARLTVHGRGPVLVRISPGDTLAPPASLLTISPGGGLEALHPILMTGSSGCEEETCEQPVLRKQNSGSLLPPKCSPGQLPGSGAAMSRYPASALASNAAPMPVAPRLPRSASVPRRRGCSRARRRPDRAGQAGPVRDGAQDRRRDG